MTPAFAHYSGTLYFHEAPLTDADVIALRELYREEVIAAFRAGDDVTYEAARSLLHQIVTAQEEQRQFRKANPAQAQWVRVMNIRRAA